MVLPFAMPPPTAVNGTGTNNIDWSAPFWPEINQICFRGVCVPIADKPKTCPVQKREDDGSKENGHDKNKRPSNWNKHTKPRPGRSNEGKRKHPNWHQNPNKRK